MQESGDKSGRLIVVEGIDGSGKKTQARLLAEWMHARGLRVMGLAFPQYGKKSAGPVEEYLNGKYGDADLLSPYAASLLFAVDRFDAAHAIRELLADGVVVLLDRYVDSNAGHQGGKFRSEKKRIEFLRWLYRIEYELLGIPRPNLTILLHVPFEISYQLVGKKQQRLYIERGIRDSHEGNLEHLKRAQQAYLWLAERDPKRYRLIDCIENDELLSASEIHERVKSAVRDTLELLM